MEPRGSSEFPAVIEAFETAAKDSSRGAILFAVCRGKASEGIDFSDHCASAVLVTGLPFPPKFDPKIRLKRAFLTDMWGSQAGNEWYVQQASRAVNQAIGRVIRHRNDYGAILLCDERFSFANQRKVYEHV